MDREFDSLLTVWAMGKLFNFLSLFFSFMNLEYLTSDSCLRLRIVVKHVTVHFHTYLRLVTMYLLYSGYLTGPGCIVLGL